MERKVTFREYETKSLDAYLDSQSKKLDMLKDFIVDGYNVDDELISIMQSFQEKGISAYERYTKVQRALVAKLQNLNVINEADSKVAIKDNKEIKTISRVIPNEIIDSIDINDPRSVKRFEVKLATRDDVSRTSSKLPTTGTIIVTGKKEDYVDELVSFLKNKGLQVAFIDTIIKDEKDAEKLVNELAKVTRISGMITLANVYDEASKEDIAYDYFLSVVYLTKYYINYLRDNKDLEHALIVFNTFMDGKLGLTGNHNNHVYASFTGFAKALAVEQAIELPGRVYVKEIDFENTMTSKEMLGAFEDELCRTDIVFEIGRTKDGSRYVTETNVTKSVVTENKCPLTKEDVVLVTGGARGVTAECLIELAKRVDCTYVILGRAKFSQENADDEETSKVKDENSMKALLAKRYKALGQKVSFVQVQKKAKAILARREMENTFDTIKKLGRKVHYYSCDVADKEGIANTIKNIELEVGAITGIIHGAGIIYDQKIHHKNMDNFKLVYGTKYKGLNYIIENIDKDKLKVLVMYSSISGYFGNDGQTDYCAANSYYDKYAYYFNKKYPNCKTLSINWGAWAGGMLDKEYGEKLMELGYVLIPLKVGANYFANEFLMGLPSRQMIITHDGDRAH